VGGTARRVWRTSGLSVSMSASESERVSFVELTRPASFCGIDLLRPPPPSAGRPASQSDRYLSADCLIRKVVGERSTIKRATNHSEHAAPVSVQPVHPVIQNRASFGAAARVCVGATRGPGDNSCSSNSGAHQGERVLAARRVV